jgi:error-prone DNA polymerase
MGRADERWIVVENFSVERRMFRGRSLRLTDYVELHCRSAFSFLRGTSTPEHLARRAAELQMPAVALCDRDGLYGAPRFFSAAREFGVRPIVGAELALETNAGGYQIILPVLVQSRIGYQNLCQLLTRGHLRNEKGKCSVRWNELSEFAEGLVALANSNVAAVYDRRSKNSDAHRVPLQMLVDAFGHKNIFVELQRHQIRGEEKIIRSLVELAERFKLPLLATNGVLYSIEEERALLDVFTCIRNHTHLDAAGKLLEQNGERYLKSAAQMRALFRDLPGAVNNTARLAERLDFTLENLGYEFPSFPVPQNSGAGFQPANRRQDACATIEAMDSFLREKAFEGARNRYDGKVPEKVRIQLETELTLITKLKVAGYFLIVWDIVQFCREQNIMAQGRGSAANSTVCFCLGITAVDPLKFKTLFERFLTEGRKNSWPDIDIDLPSGDRRERVIQEIYKRYGTHGAAMTANVITYRGRSSAREVGKALNLSPDILNRFSNLYANGDFPHTLDLQTQMEKSGLPKTHPRAAVFAALCNSIQGLPRHLGQHSGGMIISQGKLSSVVPLENASMPNRVVAQWDKDDCEDLGIIKVDFLGLGMMSVLQDTVELTQRTGKKIDLANLPEDDKKTYEMMQSADTIGIFQIESRAQMATLPRMKPENFYDLVIEVAIIRPGPIQGHLMHPYLARRAAKEPVSYYHDDLKPVLERTLGVPLFQEQMLQMAMVMADFSGAEAEELRRALSFHRSDEKMQRVEKKLRAAMQRKGHSEKVIEEVCKTVSSFALYGFPESHAISFAHLAYASAYLKAHRAPEFYASLLNNQPMGFYSPATLIKDGQRHGVKFLPVCVIKSGWDCTIESAFPLTVTLSLGERDQLSFPLNISNVSSANPVADIRERLKTILPLSEGEGRGEGEGDETTFVTSDPDAAHCAANPIRLGLRVVKTLSSSGAKRLLDERKKMPFTSLEDFKRRVRLNKDELRTLAEIGALNCFAAHRREALWEVEKELHEGDLFDVGAIHDRRTIPDANTAVTDRRYSAASPLAPMDYAERIQADFAGMKLTTGKHPMALLRSRLRDVWRAADLPQGKHGSTVRIAGNVICRQRPGTAKGFVFISLEDETGISNAIVTPPMFEANRLLITEESFLLIEGRLQHVDNVIHVKAERIERLQTDSLPAAESYDFH